MGEEELGMNRIDHTNDFMQYIMTPPVQDKEAYEQYYPKTSTMRVLNGRNEQSGLGQLPDVVSAQGMLSGNNWIMPVVIIVVSAMALMTLYAVLSKR